MRPPTLALSLPLSGKRRRFHDLVAEALRETTDALRSAITAAAEGKSIAEIEEEVTKLLPNFIWNVDEEGVDASIATLKAYGDKQVRKHQRTSASSRTKITAFRGGSAAGASTASAFLMAGKKPKEGFEDNHVLEAAGAPPGSIVVMTEGAYMNDNAMYPASEAICKSIRSHSVVRCFPSVPVVLTMDGFTSHIKLIPVMELYTSYNITAIVEESNTSQKNQPVRNLRAQFTPGISLTPLPSISPSSTSTSPGCSKMQAKFY